MKKPSQLFLIVGSLVVAVVALRLFPKEKRIAVSQSTLPTLSGWKDSEAKSTNSTSIIPPGLASQAQVHVPAIDISAIDPPKVEPAPEDLAQIRKQQAILAGYTAEPDDGKPRTQAEINAEILVIKEMIRMEPMQRLAILSILPKNLLNHFMPEVLEEYKRSRPHPSHDLLRVLKKYPEMGVEFLDDIASHLNKERRGYSSLRDLSDAVVHINDDAQMNRLAGLLVSATGPDQAEIAAAFSRSTDPADFYLVANLAEQFPKFEDLLTNMIAGVRRKRNLLAVGQDVGMPKDPAERRAVTALLAEEEPKMIERLKTVEKWKHLGFDTSWLAPLIEIPQRGQPFTPKETAERAKSEPAEPAKNVFDIQIMKNHDILWAPQADKYKNW